MSTMIAVRIPESINQRLDYLSKRTHRTKTYYVREAIVEHLDDLEDIYLAEQALERLRREEDKVIKAEEFWNGMDD